MGIFRGLTPDSICHDPFPHVVIENALDLTLCSELIDSLDNAGPIFDFSKSAPGIKSHIKSRDVLGIELIPHAWKALVKEHIDPLQLKELIAAFTPAIRQLYPFLEHQHGNIEKWTIGQRYVHSAQDFTLLVDAQLSQHAPSPNAFIQERGPHIKMTNKLLICQYLLRLKDDADEGGQYEFFSSRGRNLEFSRDQQIAASSEFRELAFQCLKIIGSQSHYVWSRDIGVEAVKNHELIRSLESEVRMMLGSPSWRLTRVFREVNKARNAGRGGLKIEEPEIDPQGDLLAQQALYIEYLRNLAVRIKSSRSWQLTKTFRRVGRK